jgi:hypothetical protein
VATVPINSHHRGGHADAIFDNLIAEDRMTQAVAIAGQSLGGEFGMYVGLIIQNSFGRLAR